MPLHKRYGHMPSGSRTLLRLQWALEFILQFMQRVSLSEDEAKLSHIASEVYYETLANHHTWLLRKMAALVMYTLSSRKHLIQVMCQHDYSHALVLLKEVCQAGQPVYDTIQQLYTDHNLL